MTTRQIPTRAGVMLAAAWVLAAGPVGLAQEPKETKAADTNRIVLSLTDGTRLACVPEAQKLAVETPYATLNVPFAALKAVTFDRKEKGQADLQLKNGDKVRGKVALESLKVKTLFGEFSVPMVHVQEITGWDAELATKKTIPDTPQNRSLCINNLRLLDHAKEVLAIKNNWVTGHIIAATPEAIWALLDPYIDGTAPLKCPSGGTYKYNPIDVAPECSIPGHKYDPNQ